MTFLRTVLAVVAVCLAATAVAAGIEGGWHGRALVAAAAGTVAGAAFYLYAVWPVLRRAVRGRR